MKTTEIHRNVDVGDVGGEGTGGWRRTASSPLLLASIPHPPPHHERLVSSVCTPIQEHCGAKFLKGWQTVTRAVGVSCRCRGSQPCGQQADTEKGGIHSTYLGIHGDIPDSGQSLQCSRRKRNLGSQISHFKATPLISLTPTPKHSLWSQADKELGLTCDLKPQFTQL